jgi:hypothetical protein
MLPPIFAVYNHEAHTFQLFQTEILFQKVVAIQPWNRPVKSCWRRYTTEQKHTNRAWLDGQQWYVVKTQEDSVSAIHHITIQNKDYSYWYLHHTLVWADIIPSKDLDAPVNWTCYPHIPILEFQNKGIYPSYQTDILPIWYKTDPISIYNISVKGWELFHELIYTETKPLRIRTPIASDSSDEDTSETQNNLPEKDPLEEDPICSFECVGSILLVCSILVGLHYFHKLF